MPALLRVNVVLDTAAVDVLRHALLDSPKQFYATVNNVVLPKAQAQIDALLNKEPPPVQYPFLFATPKSRRYYFATHDAPFQRTGEVRQWRVILKAFSGQTIEMSFENPSPVAPFVFGPRQQPGHANTGWVNADAVLPTLTAEVLANLSEVWVEQFEERQAA